MKNVYSKFHLRIQTYWQSKLPPRSVIRVGVPGVWINTGWYVILDRLI